MNESDLRELAESTVTGLGYDLEELVVMAAGRRRLVRVVVDADGGVTLDAAASVSRALAAVLDSAGDSVMGAEPYTLEVTSPGVGRPLTEARHFRRARGRWIVITPLVGDAVEGRVRRVVGDQLELLVNPAGTATIDVPLASIRRAKVQVEFAAVSGAHAALLAADGFVDPARAFDSGDFDDELDSDNLDTELHSELDEELDSDDLDDDQDNEPDGTHGEDRDESPAAEGEQL